MMKYIVAHTGARDYYNLSVALNNLGSLEKLYTDYYAAQKGNPFLKPYNHNRFNTALPLNKIKAYNNYFLGDNLYMKLSRNNNLFDKWVRWGGFFAKRVVSDLQRSGNKNPIWGFSTSSLELLKYCEISGIPSIQTQIDGGMGYYKIYQEVLEQYPFAEKKKIEPTQAFSERIAGELTHADRIVVNSNYIKKLLLDTYPFLGQKQMDVLPLAFSMPEGAAVAPKSIDPIQPVHVLWAGNVNLVKGFMQFYETAKALSGKGFIFTAAGHSSLEDSFFKQASTHINFTGRVKKSELYDLYSTSHVFVFPSLCDSFGMVQLEAMSFGLPVIASTCCADIVTDGIDGFYINNNTESLIEKLCLLRNDKALFQSCSENALSTAKSYSIDALVNNVKHLIHLN